MGKQRQKWENGRKSRRWGCKAVGTVVGAHGGVLIVQALGTGVIAVTVHEQHGPVALRPPRPAGLGDTERGQGVSQEFPIPSGFGVSQEFPIPLGYRGVIQEFPTPPESEAQPGIPNPISIWGFS